MPASVAKGARTAGAVSLGAGSPLSYVLGFMCGLPISYPGPPFYWLAFVSLAITMLLALYRRFNALERVYLAIVALMTAVSVIANLASPYAYVLEPGRFLTTSFFYVFLLVGLAVRDFTSFVRGLVAVVALQAAAVIVMALVKFGWSLGFANWIVPELRLWGTGIFPDWPNFYAIMLLCGFMGALLILKRPYVAALCLIAAVLTTSRMAIVGVTIAFAWAIIAGGRRVPRGLMLASAGAGAVTVAVLVLMSGYSSDIIDRFILVSDRVAIFESAFEVLGQSPFLGVGGVLLDESVGHTGHASFHDTYLDVAVRQGLLGLSLFLALIVIGLSKLSIRSAVWPLLMLLLIGALFQNVLRHPHFAILFSAILFHIAQALGRTAQGAAPPTVTAAAS